MIVLSESGFTALELAEVLKHKGSKALLLTLLHQNHSKFTINSLARVSKVPFSTTWNIVKEWEKNGFVETEKVGNALVVSLNENNSFKRLKEFLFYEVKTR